VASCVIGANDLGEQDAERLSDLTVVVNGTELRVPRVWYVMPRKEKKSEEPQQSRKSAAARNDDDSDRDGYEGSSDDEEAAGDIERLFEDLLNDSGSNNNNTASNPRDPSRISTCAVARSFRPVVHPPRGPPPTHRGAVSFRAHSSGTPSGSAEIFPLTLKGGTSKAGPYTNAIEFFSAIVSVVLEN